MSEFLHEYGPAIILLIIAAILCVYVGWMIRSRWEARRDALQDPLPLTIRRV